MRAHRCTRQLVCNGSPGFLESVLLKAIGQFIIGHVRPLEFRLQKPDGSFRPLLFRLRQGHYSVQYHIRLQDIISDISSIDKDLIYDIFELYVRVYHATSRSIPYDRLAELIADAEPSQQSAVLHDAWRDYAAKAARPYAWTTFAQYARQHMMDAGAWF